MRRRASFAPIAAILAAFVLLPAARDVVWAQAAPQAAPGPASAPAPDPAAGFVPPPVDLAHVRLAAPDPQKTRDLPARYDARDLGLVSAAKNQGACGSCYAFAAAADLESRILAAHGIEVDLSENQIKECHWEERSCNGGNAQMVMNLLTRRGAARESCDPYVAGDVACDQACAAAFAVRGWRWLNGSALPDVAALKQALVDHGPLSTTVFAGDASTPAWQSTFNGWNGGTGLHYTGPGTSNHAVVLVGWDDDQPHAGGGTGCWIVKNSWGAAWGDDCGSGGEGGYFYIAYGSARIGTYTTVVTDVMPAYPELAVLGWDEGGWTGSYGYQQPQAWALARFDATEVGFLHCVEFWTTDACTDLEIHVYDSFAGGSLGGLLASQAGLGAPAAGYHSVALVDPLPLTPGNDYYVAVRFQNASYGYPVAVDGQGARGAGHTWISYGGSNWTDLGQNAACEAGIRIRTSPHLTLPVDPDHADGAAGGEPAVPLAHEDFTLRAPWPNPFNPATTLAFELGAQAGVRLRVFDLQGRLVRTLVAADLPAGRHQARWNGRDDRGRSVPAGVYLARLDDGWRVRSQRLVMVK